jgi:hypothetical protein
MKKLLTTLVVLTWTFLLAAQTVPSPFAGQWFGVATPTGLAAKSGFTRSLMGISIADDGSVLGTRFYYDSEEFDQFSAPAGALSSKGKLTVVTTDLEESLTLIFSKGGKGTGVNRFTSAVVTNVVLRESITLYREVVKQ